MVKRQGAKRRNVRSVDTAANARRKNYLSEKEVDRLIAAAKKRGRYPVRDGLLILMAYRHGLRISEALKLNVSDLDLERHRVWIERSKGSLSTEHPIAGDELRAIKKYLADRERKSAAPQLFITERGTPMSRQNAYDLISKAGEAAGLGHVHPHMLRHSCGYHMASEGVDFRTAQDFLGHSDPKHTAAYMRINASRFNSVWGRR
jgi:type 1 fimbriae regulatory protein FimB/type 1 fimbriae regulatory protein FimE